MVAVQSANHEVGTLQPVDDRRVVRGRQLVAYVEQQILQWIYHGKSNIEIGMILDISPLTVKNHVQKTLRKLNVLNRTQAVGKALALRLVNP